jgi:hypothetical protein
VIKGGRSGNASYRAKPDPFFDAVSKNDVHFGPQTSMSKAHPLLWAKKGVFLLFFAVLVVLEHFSYKNRPIDLVRGLFSSEDIGPYIPSTCGPLCTFLGPFGVLKSPKTA